MNIEVRRGGARFVTEGDGKRTRHSFSYGSHYDPDNIRFGPIRAVNTELLEPGAEYSAHRHSDVEIVTWVLHGALRHTDSAGGGGVITPGVAQRLSAGSGAEHTEANASSTEPVTFIQMMLDSDYEGEPEYSSATLTLTPGELHPTVDVHAAAELKVVRLRAEMSVDIPSAQRCLVHLAHGSVDAVGVALGTGDELRLIDAGPLTVTASRPAELLLWFIDASDSSAMR